MSQYSRAERNANAGIVVSLTAADYAPYGTGALAGIAFQRHWEERAFTVGGGDYHAPAQRVGDFLAGRPSTALGSVTPSYKPGVRPTDLAACLPDFAVAAIREALPAFDKRIPGFAMEDAVMTGVETRTSSPVRIPRAADGHSVNTPGLFPAGEGAGYAGGILSAGRGWHPHRRSRRPRDAGGIRFITELSLCFGRGTLLKRACAAASLLRFHRTRAVARIRWHPARRCL